MQPTDVVMPIDKFRACYELVGYVSGMVKSGYFDAATDQQLRAMIDRASFKATEAEQAALRG